MAAYVPTRDELQAAVDDALPWIAARLEMPRVSWCPNFASYAEVNGVGYGRRSAWVDTPLNGSLQGVQVAAYRAAIAMRDLFGEGMCLPLDLGGGRPAIHVVEDDGNYVRWYDSMFDFPVVRVRAVGYKKEEAK